MKLTLSFHTRVGAPKGMEVMATYFPQSFVYVLWLLQLLHNIFFICIGLLHYGEYTMYIDRCRILTKAHYNVPL